MVIRSADQLVDLARSAIERFTPSRALQCVREGALLVDIRPIHQRREHGIIPQAVCIERNVLEWRLDPSGAYKIPEATHHDRHVLILCQQGYASSLAAASLKAMGYQHTGDVIGGFDAWQAEGLPITPGPA